MDASPQWEWVEVERSVIGARAARKPSTADPARRIVDRGVRNGIEYRYAVVGHDEAGHAKQSIVKAMPLGPFALRAR